MEKSSNLEARYKVPETALPSKPDRAFAVTVSHRDAIPGQYGRLAFCRRGRLAAIDCPCNSFRLALMSINISLRPNFTSILDPRISPKISNTQPVHYNGLITFLQHFQKFIGFRLLTPATCKTLPA